MIITLDPTHRYIPVVNTGRTKMSLICGIDLAGTESRPTGICLLDTTQRFHTLYTDEDIYALVQSTAPSLVAVDAPLSYTGQPFRDGDAHLRREYPLLPLTFKGMQKLAQRGIQLKSHLSPPLIEVYPHASKHRLGIQTSEDLRIYGFSTLPGSIHELDAAAAALTGQYYLRGKYTMYGICDPIIVPVK